MNSATTLDALSRFLHRQLSIWLALIDQTCLPPEATPGGETVWPDGETLGELNSTVLTLAIMERKKPSASRWKAYKCVSKRWQKYHLVSRVEKLVRRARARLQEGERPLENSVTVKSRVAPA
jgi:hypothetical protein